MLKLKLQYFGHLMRRANSLEKTLMLGKIEGKGDRGRSNIDSMDMNLSKLWETVENRGAWHAAVNSVAVRHDLATEQQQKQMTSI